LAVQAPRRRRRWLSDVCELASRTSTDYWTMHAATDRACALFEESAVHIALSGGYEYGVDEDRKSAGARGRLPLNSHESQESAALGGDRRRSWSDSKRRQREGRSEAVTTLLLLGCAARRGISCSLTTATGRRRACRYRWESGRRRPLDQPNEREHPKMRSAEWARSSAGLRDTERQ